MALELQLSNGMGLQETRLTIEKREVDVEAGRRGADGLLDPCLGWRAALGSTSQQAATDDPHIPGSTPRHRHKGKAGNGSTMSMLE